MVIASGNMNHKSFIVGSVGHGSVSGIYFTNNVSHFQAMHLDIVTGIGFVEQF